VKVETFSTPAAVARAAATRIARLLKRRGRPVLLLPVGKTAVPICRELARLHAAGRAPFRRATTFNLDELRVPPEDPRSFRAFMDRHLFSKVDLDARRIRFLRGDAPDVARECARYERELAREGPPDLALVGIGENGHVAYLEPSRSLPPTTSLVRLSASTRRGLAADGLQPVPREALFEALGRVRQRAAPVPARRRARILSFVGCKGGSGATFIATNVAHLLAEQEGKKVALIDLNFQFGDAALYVTHRVPARTLADVADEAHRLDASLLANSMLQVLPNFHILPAPEDPEQALRVRPESIDPLLEVAGSAYDVVIVDAGRTLDDVTVRAMDRSDAVYAVLQLNLPFLRDAKRLLRVLTSLGYGRDKVKLVVNRFHKRSTITLQDLQETLQHEVFRTLPNSFDAVTASVNQGVPIFKLASRDPVSRGLREIAGTLVEAKKEAGGWRRLLSR